jgi:1-acyl-sn-glycerol-3-phosphate acyltransferase
MRYKEMDTVFDRLVYRSAYHLYNPLGRLAFGTHVTGREYIPQDGPALIASNHRSWLDAVALPAAARDRHVTMVARDDLSSNSFVQWLLNHLEAVQIGRHDFSTDDLRLVDARLETGRLIGIFPEETRGDSQLRKTNRAANLGKLKPGVASFARRHQVPTIPAAVSGLDNPLKSGQRRIARAAFGEPIDPPGRGRGAKQDYLDELRYQIQGLYERHLVPLKR